jgi:hypothetical protein
MKRSTHQVMGPLEWSLLVTFLIPVSALLLGMVMLGEHLDLRHFAGMGMISCGLAAIDGRLKTFIVSRMFAKANAVYRKSRFKPAQMHCRNK